MNALEAVARASNQAHEHGVNENTLCRWKWKYGGMEVSEVRRLKELETGLVDQDSGTGCFFINLADFF